MSIDWKKGAPVRVLCHGVGGMGMAPLAIMMAEAGHEVAGKDRHLSPLVGRLLAEAGVCLLEEDDPEGRVDLVVHSSAVPPEDERLKTWVRAGVPVIRRGDCLASLLSERKVVAVAGSHGKTTTTALLVHLLRRSGRKPGWMIGGIPSQFSPGSWGGEDWMIVEVDESDGTIGSFHPELTGWINLDLDHTDRYRDHESIAQVFRKLCLRTKGGVVVGPHFNHGLNHSVGLHIVKADGKGMNAVNQAVALKLFSLMVGGPAPTGGFDDFDGIHRRQERLTKVVPEIWTDYAHHPTEIARFLERETSPVSWPCTVVFQPHRYTRTRSMAGDLAEALSPADKLILLPVYGAGEIPLPDGQSDRIAKACQERGRKVTMVADRFDLPEALAGLDGSSGSLAFIGAGDVDLLARLHAAHRETEDAFSSMAIFLRRQLRSPDSVRLGEKLARFSTMGVGGEAAVYVEPENLAELRIVLMATRFFRVPFFVMGRGSNLLISEEGYGGVVIRLQKPFWRRIRRLDEERIRVGGGARLRELSRWGVRQGDSAYAFLDGIPGSLGGALKMNAGAMGKWVYQLVKRVEVLSPEGELSLFEAEGLEVGYRRAPWLGDQLVVSAELSCVGKDTPDQALDLLRKNRRKRKSTQPPDPSCGCIFRNPPGDSAGRLIDACGLKGLGEGGALVSDRHANFILNRGGATADDVFRLICRVREEVMRKTGVALEPEVVFLGPFAGRKDGWPGSLGTGGPG